MTTTSTTEPKTGNGFEVPDDSNPVVFLLALVIIAVVVALVYRRIWRK